jgi:acetoin utilization deacetylase AcuC-like enzyme
LLYTSVHLFNEDRTTFFPGTGGLCENTLCEDPIYPGGILNVPCAHANLTSDDWRSLYLTQVFPRLSAFKPDILFVSAGFDAHEGDPIH